MHPIVRAVGTPISPVLVQITNQMPESYRPSGALTADQQAALDRLQHPYTNPDGSTNMGAVAWTAVSTASMAASAYHGYKRNTSVGWALWWGLCGGLFPVIVPTIAVAQGFGKREGK
jgi:hypothetical protein